MIDYATDPHALVVRGADLSRAAPPKWAWQQWLVLGYLNLLIGNEGVGKGTFVCWLLARLTRGELPGDLFGVPITVGVLGDEDDFDGVWVPRLHAQNADLERVVQIEGPDGGYVNIAADRERLGQVVIHRAIKALFCDQLLDNLGAGTDDWRQKAVRDALQPTRALARELEILVLGSLHPNKRAESFRQLVSGAAAFNALSRSSLLIAAHPDDDTRRVLARGKGNLSKTPDSVEFRIDEHRFTANGFDFAVPLATDFTRGSLTVDDLLGSDTIRVEHSKVAEACEIIEALLPMDGVWHPAKPMLDACQENNLDDRTAQRAKNRLQIEHRRTSSFPAAVEWRWPATRDAHTTSESAVASVGTVGTEKAQKSLLSSSDDTHDTYDVAFTSRVCVGSVREVICAACGDICGLGLGVDTSLRMARERAYFEAGVQTFAELLDLDARLVTSEPDDGGLTLERLLAAFPSEAAA